MFGKADTAKMEEYSAETQYNRKNSNSRINLQIHFHIFEIRMKL